MSGGRRTDLISLAVLGAAATLLIAWLILRSASGLVDPLSAVPADSFLVVSIDVVALARSPLGEALVGEGGARTGTLLGVDSITATCGFDPLHHLRAIAVAIPEGGERGDFGVAASGDLTRDALTSCARALVAKRGGQASVHETGTFTVVSDANAPGGAEVAFREGGPFLVGRGAWLARMMDAAAGRVPSMATSPGAHSELRSELARRDTDAEAVVASAILPRELRDRIRREMEGEAKATDAKGAGAMDGVLAVSEGALGVHAGRAHEETRIVAELRCESESACESVATVILHARLGWSGNLGYRLLGLGALIDGLEVQRQGTSLVVRTRAPADDLAKTIERALHPPPRSKAGAPAAPRPPDEIVRPDGGK